MGHKSTPRQKYLTMNRVMEFGRELADHQARYVAPICANPQCGKEVKSLPNFLVGKTDLCYGCWEESRKPKPFNPAHIDHDAQAFAESFIWDRVKEVPF